MSILKEHAVTEFELHRAEFKDNAEESMILPYESPIMKIVDIFSEQGHSGGSAPYGIRAITDTIKRLLSFEPITPITGKDEEWSNDISDNELYQNKRCPALFKENGKSYYLDAIVWRTQNGSTWCGTTEEGYTSRQYVKFPFTPKTFYIDVIEYEVSKDDWEFKIKDPEQLKEVFEYYDEFERNA